MRGGTIGESRFAWPAMDAVEAVGNVMYNEGMRTWNTLRLTRQIVQEFPLLRSKGSRVGYKAVLPRGLKKIEEMFSAVKNGKLPPPLMLFFFEV